MFKVKLGPKTYKVDYVRAKAMRTIGAPQAVYKRWMQDAEGADIQADLDVLVKWFCTFCGDQFTPEEVFDNYPGDRIITDIGVALAAANAQVTSALEAFPTGGETKKKQMPRWKTWLTKFTGIFSKKGGSRKK